MDRKGAGIRIGRLSPRRRRGLVVTGLAMALLFAVLPAFGDTPESGSDPNVTLTVTPDDLVGVGQQVTVTGAGFPPNTPGIIRQCSGTVAAPQCDMAVAATFVTTASGEIPPTVVTAKRILDTGTTTFNCGVQACALVATAGGTSSRHHIAIAGAGTVVPTSTSVPPSSSSTILPPSTTIPPAPSTTIPPVFDRNLICAILQSLVEPLAFLGGLITNLLAVFGCGAP